MHHRRRDQDLSPGKTLLHRVGPKRQRPLQRDARHHLQVVRSRCRNRRIEIPRNPEVHHRPHREGQAPRVAGRKALPEVQSHQDGEAMERPGKTKALTFSHISNVE